MWNGTEAAGRIKGLPRKSPGFGEWLGICPISTESVRSGRKNVAKGALFILHLKCYNNSAFDERKSGCVMMGDWKETGRQELRGLGTRLLALLKWCGLAVVLGLGIGLVGAAFHEAVSWATRTRGEFPWLLYLLPAAGLAIVGLYRLAGVYEDKGTNLVLAAVRGEASLPFRTAPLIFIASSLTHLCGGSSGREGAALQIGGSIASSFGRHLGFGPEDQRVLVVCGMSAAFSALFGTPLTAAVFSMEVAQIGVMRYAALVPALVSALTAVLLAGRLGLAPTAYAVAEIPALTSLSLARTVLLGVLCALVAVLFFSAMHAAHGAYARYLKNPYLRAAVGGGIVVILTLLSGSRDYNGAGGELIAAAVAGEAAPWAFLLKILFTALTLGAGFKGGEIVPAFFTGATFGCAAGPLLGLPASFAAAAGIVSVFCGVTNCPLASVLLSYELFGGEGLPLYAAACAVSWLVSGRGGLYSAQTVYSD